MSAGIGHADKNRRQANQQHVRKHQAQQSQHQDEHSQIHPPNERLGKKWENHWAAVALWFAFYNFCRVHKSLRVTPAMEAGIADHVRTVRELLEAA